MKKTFLTLILCIFPSLLLYADPESSQVLDKLDSIEKTISDLSFRIFALEKRILSFEENFLFKEKPHADHYMKSDPRTGGITEDSEPPPGNFSFLNVTYTNNYNDTVFKGEVTNQSNKSYRYALFKICVFNDKGTVLSSNDFYILNLDRGTQRSFEAKLHGIKIHEFVDYAIEFNKGS
ncbi:MAG: hypothetical protein GY941_09205 [Planctomycetes bacterium]|nr:hypothetical protein [Planctomycetota bacterium]